MKLENAIEVKDVSMCFNLSREKVDSIKEYVIKVLKRQLFYEEFWALNDVSFEIRKGDSVGLIGMNGSGKSTMLKIIAGVLKPTKGTVETTGTIAPMIELGAGFDHDLTARENIFLNGALIGYSQEMLEERFDDIISFAGLERFVDVPIKNFSSGMLARLGFSIATIVDADILIIGGTSLAVYPAAGLINYYRGSKLVLVNKSETPADRSADLVIHAPIGEVFSQL